MSLLAVWSLKPATESVPGTSSPANFAGSSTVLPLPHLGATEEQKERGTLWTVTMPQNLPRAFEDGTSVIGKSFPLQRMYSY
jgi:hypothetical protein